MRAHESRTAVDEMDDVDEMDAEVALRCAVRGLGLIAFIPV
jgi:hypothetical protein